MLRADIHEVWGRIERASKDNMNAHDWRKKSISAYRIDTQALSACAFAEACRADHNRGDILPCAVIRGFFWNVPATALKCLEHLRCDGCWRELLFMLDEYRAAHVREGPVCRAHMSSISPVCAMCSTAFYGFRAIDERILVGAPVDVMMLRFAFLGACVALDNVCALRIYLRYILRLKSAPSDMLNGIVCQLMRDCLAALGVSSQNHISDNKVRAFVAQCYFPARMVLGNGSIVEVNGKNIWSALLTCRPG